MTFLLVEEPRYRWATLQYAIEGLWGKRRSWRATVARRTPSILPRWRKLLAYLSGPRLYLRSRRLRVSSLPRAAVP
jgi:hypothetical protein